MAAREFQRPTRSPLRAADLAIVALALLAPALGGTTELWAQAVVVFGLALLLLWSPPGTSPRWLALPLVGLLLLSLFAFLPAAWFGANPWRQRLVNDLDLALPGTLSPQPWLTLENALMLGSTLVWAAFLATRDWTSKRSALLSVYVGGVTLLGLAGLAFGLAGYRPPFWPPGAGGLGFFPNRNQAGNVLALGGLIALALAFHRFQRERWSGLVWAACYAVLGVAVVVNFSRAGMGIFFLGSLAWLVWVIWQTRWLKSSALGLACVLVAITLFLIFGDKSLERFLPQPDPAVESTVGGRFRMQAEALPLLNEASWHGIGLGNFQHAFPGYQKASALLNERAIHPESDWIWVGVELGWLAPVFILAVVAAWLGRQWPRAGESHFLLRSAIVVCGLAFLLHGVVDVSGHRVGSVWPAIFLVSLLRRAEVRSRKVEGRGPKAVGAAYRGLAVLLLAVAIFWLGSVLQLHSWPTSVRLRAVEASIERAQEHRYCDLVIQLTSAALPWAPLERDLYFHRALARLRSGQDIVAALADFHRARELDGNSSELPMAEGLAWLERDPRLALAAWREALARAGRLERCSPAAGASREGELYRRMLAAAGRITGLRNDLRALAGDDRELLLVFLAQATPEEFDQELRKLMFDDPALQTLTSGQRATLFVRWAKMGDRALFEQKLRENPGWMDTAWRGWAAVLAEHDAFAEACGLVQRFAPPPALPSVLPTGNLAELHRRLLLTTNDFSAGYALYCRDLARHDPEDALSTLEKLTVQRDCPRYFHFLEARLCAERGAWPQAWRAWKQYLGPE